MRLVAMIAGSLLSAGYLFGQQSTAKTPSETKQDDPSTTLNVTEALMEQKLALLGLGSQDTEAVKGVGTDLDTVMSILGDAPKDAKTVRAIAGHSLWKYYLEKGSARSAPQVSQLANEQMLHLGLLQVQQNQRIIELLEQMGKRSSGNGK
jgi:hypothetical protein